MDSRNYQQAPDLSGYKQLNKDDSKNQVEFQSSKKKRKNREKTVKTLEDILNEENKKREEVVKKEILGEKWLVTKRELEVLIYYQDQKEKECMVKKKTYEEVNNKLLSISSKEKEFQQEKQNNTKEYERIKNELAQVQDQAFSSQARQKKSEEKLETSRKQKAEMEKKLETSRKQKAEMEEKLKASRKQKAEMEEKLETSRKQKAEMEEKLKASQDQIESQRQKIAELGKEEKGKIRENEENKNKIDTLKEKKLMIDNIIEDIQLLTSQDSDRCSRDKKISVIEKLQEIGHLKVQNMKNHNQFLNKEVPSLLNANYEFLNKLHKGKLEASLGSETKNSPIYEDVVDLLEQAEEHTFRKGANEQRSYIKTFFSQLRELYQLDIEEPIQPNVVSLSPIESDDVYASRKSEALDLLNQVIDRYQEQSKFHDDKFSPEKQTPFLQYKIYKDDLNYFKELKKLIDPIVKDAENMLQGLTIDKEKVKKEFKHLFQKHDHLLNNLKEHQKKHLSEFNIEETAKLYIAVLDNKDIKEKLAVTRTFIQEIIDNIKKGEANIAKSENSAIESKREISSNLTLYIKTFQKFEETIYKYIPTIKPICDFLYKKIEKLNLIVEDILIDLKNKEKNIVNSKKDEIKEIENEIKNHEEALQKTQNQLDNTITQKQAHQTKFNELHQSISALSFKVEELSQEESKASHKITEFSNKITEADKHRKISEDFIGEYQSKIEKYTQHIEKIQQDDIKIENNHQNNYKKELSKIKQDKEKYEQIIENFKKNAKKYEYNKEIDRYNTKKKQIEEHMQNIYFEKKEYDKKIDTKEIELKNLENKMKNANSNINSEQEHQIKRYTKDIYINDMSNSIYPLKKYTLIKENTFLTALDNIEKLTNLSDKLQQNKKDNFSIEMLLETYHGKLQAASQAAEKSSSELFSVLKELHKINHDLNTIWSGLGIKQIIQGYKNDIAKISKQDLKDYLQRPDTEISIALEAIQKTWDDWDKLGADAKKVLELPEKLAQVHQGIRSTLAKTNLTSTEMIDQLGGELEKLFDNSQDLVDTINDHMDKERYQSLRTRILEQQVLLVVPEDSHQTWRKINSLFEMHPTLLDEYSPNAINLLRNLSEQYAIIMQEREQEWKEFLDKAEEQSDTANHVTHLRSLEKKHIHTQQKKLGDGKWNMLTPEKQEKICNLYTQRVEQVRLYTERVGQVSGETYRRNFQQVFKLSRELSTAYEDALAHLGVKCARLSSSAK